MEYKKKEDAITSAILKLISKKAKIAREKFIYTDLSIGKDIKGKEIKLLLSSEILESIEKIIEVEK